MYALFDWDYTLRKGFTVFDLAGYFSRHGVLSPRTLPKMDELREEYDKGALTHDELSKAVPEVFSLGLKGMATATVEKAVDDYIVSQDAAAMHPFTGAVFGFCRKRGIETIIVSGAPGLVVRRYADSLGIASVNAFDFETADGFCSGRVLINNGFNKGETVRRIVEQRGERPLFAMGDSPSDAPLLGAARIRISVGANSDWVPDKENHYNCRACENGDELVRFLELRIAMAE